MMRAVPCLVLILPLIAGCITAPVVPPTGMIFAHYQAPLDTDYAATPAAEMREGRASAETYLMLVTVGDASAHTAALEGGLTTIESADYEFFNVLGIYQRYTTIVRGK